MMAHFEHLALRSRKGIIIPSTIYTTFLKPHHVTPPAQYRTLGSKTQIRQMHLDAIPKSFLVLQSPSPSQLLLLPKTCPGCGAFTQSTSSDQAGFYSVNRKSVKAYIAQGLSQKRDIGESYIYKKSLEQVDPSLLQSLPLNDITNSMEGVLLCFRISSSECIG